MLKSMFAQVFYRALAFSAYLDVSINLYWKGIKHSSMRLAAPNHSMTFSIQTLDIYKEREREK